MEWLILLLCFIVTGASPPSISKTYRSDYVYNEKTDAFYKLHIDGVILSKANQLCSLEGANLLFPENDMEFNQFHAMLKKYPDINYVWVADDGETHMEAENVVVFAAKDTPVEYDYPSPRPTGNCNLMNKLGEVRTLDHTYCGFGELHPFICKVEAKDAPYDEVCDVYDSGYEYDTTVGSCYKIPSIPLTWNAAYDQCKAVRSHLVVLNSEAEHAVVHRLMLRTPLIKHSHHNLYFSAGFHVKPGTRDFLTIFILYSEAEHAVEQRLMQRTLIEYSHHKSYFIAGFGVKPGTRDFLTIFNQTMEEAGYAVWSDHEPNNFNNNEDCGSLFKNDGRLNDFSCTDAYGYICEKEKPI